MNADHELAAFLICFVLPEGLDSFPEDTQVDAGEFAGSYHMAIDVPKLLNCIKRPNMLEHVLIIVPPLCKLAGPSSIKPEVVAVCAQFFGRLIWTLFGSHSIIGRGNFCSHVEASKWN